MVEDDKNKRLPITPPIYLGKRAKATWRKIVPFLEKQSSVKKIDSGLVEFYCTQYEIYRNAYEHVLEHGEVQAIYKTLQDNLGNVLGQDFVGFKRNPMTNIYSDSLKNLAKIGSELGLSPKSRSELLGLNEPGDDDKDSQSQLKDFFNDE